MIIPCTSPDQAGWLELRQALWPDEAACHLADMAELCAAPERYAQFLALSDDGAALGLLEMALRGDYVNGTDSSPVAFLEGIYVVPEARGQGLARALVAEAERWAKARGASEFASDAALDNLASHAMHRALGFEETERVVFFRKSLSDLLDK